MLNNMENNSTKTDKKIKRKERLKLWKNKKINKIKIVNLKINPIKKDPKK